MYQLVMKYVPNPTEGNEFEAAIDTTIDDEIRSLADAFLGLLFDSYQSFLDCGVPKPPQEILADTAKAHAEMDPVRRFVSNNYERVQNNTSYLTTEEVLADMMAEPNFASVGRLSLIKQLDVALAGKELQADERKISVGNTSVRGWRRWRRMEL